MKRFLLAVLLLTPVRVASAQEIRGAVLDSATSRPVAGAVLFVLDSGGRSLVRNLTNERGEYRVPILAGAARLRFQRIGYRPREVVLPPVAGDVTRLDLNMAPIPRLLEPVVATANPLCPRRADSETALALWQQARTGLLATVVAREANPAQLGLLVYQRTLMGSPEAIVDQRVRADSGEWAMAFAATYSASEFVRSGFRSEDAGVVTYHGPDADVLLEEVFQSVYCFSIADRSRDRPQQVGLRFAPARPERGRTDIEGALWIDTTGRVLRDIEYQYLGFPKALAERYRPGGHIDFREMPNGIVLVDRWSVRVLEQQPGPTSPLSRRYYITEGGAEIAGADWADGTRWRATLGAARLRVTDGQGRPLAGIRVELDSTHYSAVTDSAGVASMSRLLPGPYRAILIDSMQAKIGLSGSAVIPFVAARDSTSEVALVARSDEEIVRGLCDRGSGQAHYLLVARIVDERGAPIKGARWRLGTTQRATGSDGLLRACGSLLQGASEVIEIQIWLDRSRYTEDAPMRVTVEISKPLMPVRIQLTAEP